MEATAPGGIVTYTLTYTNSTGSTIYNANITDLIPASTTFVPGTAKLNGATISPDPVQDGALVISLGDLAAGASGTVQFQVRVN